MTTEGRPKIIFLDNSSEVPKPAESRLATSSIAEAKQVIDVTPKEEVKAIEQ